MSSLVKSDRPFKEPPPVAAQRHPLGLPAGSIRALLTLLIVSVVVMDLATGKAPTNLWGEALLVAVAFYFASRRNVQLSPEALAHLTQFGLLEKEENPLFLPRHSIRVLIFASFIGLGVHLAMQGRLLAKESIALLTIIASFLLGLIIRGMVKVAGSQAQSKSGGRLTDLQAGITVVALAASAALHWTSNQSLVPAWTDDISLALALFYFGTR